MTQRLECHKEAVNFMIFSPSPSASIAFDIEKTTISRERPIILVSISEEICFWNITHVLNNPMERSNHLRLSQRINRKSNINRADPQMIHTNGNASKPKATSSFGNHLLVEQVIDANTSTTHELGINNPWIGKTGTSKKPELLSCIKFVGSSAEKLYANRAFDTFITVDNEGVIYFLKADNQLNEM